MHYGNQKILSLGVYIMKKILSSLALLLLLFSQNVLAQLPNAEKALIHTQTARTFSKGQLGIYTNMNFYSKIGDFLGDVKPADFSAKNYWLVASNLVFTYGIMEHLDASLGIRLYQDTHYDNEFNLPDDIFLTIKTGSYSFGRNRFSQAGLVSFRFPTGEVHNYPFTEYTTNSVQFGFMYALSYYNDPYLPQRSFNMHFNAGFWFYNEYGTVLFDPKKFDPESTAPKLEADINSSDYRMALAFAYPTGLFDFRLEMTGMLFLTDPNTFVYSNEEWAFLSPSIRYSPVNWLAVDLGVDFRLSPGDRNSTVGLPDPTGTIDLPPNFPAWKVQMGLNINLNLMGENAFSDLSYEESRARKKVQAFEAVVEEREKTESIQQEIDNLKKVRQEAEKEIDDLKKILDEQ
jgi:hypothetical protein